MQTATDRKYDARLKSVVLIDYRIFRVGTPFDRVWHNNIFLTGSLQSKETLPETKKRKEFLSPFFSKSAIQRLEPILHRQKLIKFLSTVQRAAQANNGEGEVVDFFLGFRCLTADTIMDYCFQQDVDALSKPGFQDKTMIALVESFDLAIIGSFFPNFFSFVNSIIFSLPEATREAKFAPVYGWETIQNLARERVEHAIKVAEEGKQKDRNIPTMFDAMLNPDRAKGQVTPPMKDMVAEGVLMIAAGTDTTANVLGLVLWHVTQDKEVEKKLLQELKRAMPERDALLDSATLEGEGFEYLRAVVKESLRLGHGVPGRIIRKVPKDGATLGGMFVPGGVSICDS